MNRDYLQIKRILNRSTTYCCLFFFIQCFVLLFQSSASKEIETLDLIYSIANQQKKTTDSVLEYYFISSNQKKTTAEEEIALKNHTFWRLLEGAIETVRKHYSRFYSSTNDPLYPKESLNTIFKPLFIELMLQTARKAATDIEKIYEGFKLIHNKPGKIELVVSINPNDHLWYLDEIKSEKFHTDRSKEFFNNVFGAFTKPVQVSAIMFDLCQYYGLYLSNLYRFFDFFDYILHGERALKMYNELMIDLINVNSTNFRTMMYSVFFSYQAASEIGTLLESQLLETWGLVNIFNQHEIDFIKSFDLQKESNFWVDWTGLKQEAYDYDLVEKLMGDPKTSEHYLWTKMRNSLYGNYIEKLEALELKELEKPILFQKKLTAERLQPTEMDLDYDDRGRLMKNRLEIMSFHQGIKSKPTSKAESVSKGEKLKEAEKIQKKLKKVEHVYNAIMTELPESQIDPVKHSDLLNFVRQIGGYLSGNKTIHIPHYDKNGNMKLGITAFSMHFRHGCSNKKQGSSSDIYTLKEIRKHIPKNLFQLTGIPQLIDAGSWTFL